MRFTTRLDAMISMLVALTIFLMLVGVTFSFVFLNKRNAEQHLRALSTSVDQSLLASPPSSLKNWMPLVMNQLDISSVEVIAHHGPLYSHDNQHNTGSAWDSHFPDLSPNIFLCYSIPISS